MKKRILTLAIALILVIFTAIPAVAADPITAAGGTGTAVLSYTVASTFSVTIPEAVTITNGSGTGTISVADSIIPYNEELTVTITAAMNYDDNLKFRLKNNVNNNYINYGIKEGDNDVVKDTPFLTVVAGTPNGSATLTYTADAPTIAGTYTDTLTFTVATPTAQSQQP